MGRESLTNIFLESTLYLQIVLYFVLIIILLLFSALISGSETAFFCLEKKTIDREIRKNRYRGDKVLKILKNRKKLLATILISNNFSNIGIVILSSYLITKYFTDSFFHKIPINFLLEVILLTFILLLFGEIIPKIYARKNNFRFAILMSQTLIYLSKILGPISKIMILVSRFIEKRMKKKKNRISVDQLSKALKIASSNQKNVKECQFLQRIVDFGNTETHQIMTPRIDMFALNKKTLFSNILELVRNQGYSRIPVYKDSIDDIEGVLFAKDLLPFIHEKEFEWIKLIHTPFFVPENKKIDDLLNDFKKIKIHLAIVVDEYGGTCGLVTLEDVIEEIVGDIIDEYDEEVLSYSKLNQNNYLFDGKTSLIDFYRIMKIKEEVFFEKKKGDADTLGGFIMEINKEFPKQKQKINFLNYSFLIRRIDNKRIKSIEVIRKKNK
ncbi:gliding motility-associated protein GldE [Blattabacterium sp. (Cryptocercus kyebangensis)]|uniref:gliding motility-associated protein GldE n=1 Tax=Blattabacterium sp. (Cryptocercus kyebangensis) TaxID=298656 RepID=UPI000D7C3B7E|nr:gliding motility-associated protein GldE [Blattabacterium sp. (Cryptocercus kyebangensis)]AWU43917.1 gliding motility-associated protein GldE [Blattabacterium sp. (Cryptocercus kyebangensis)]